MWWSRGGGRVFEFLFLKGESKHIVVAEVYGEKIRGGGFVF